jgi:hypothetical protein
MERRHKIALAAGGMAALLILLWLGRAWLAGQVARQYFAGHGVASRVEIGDLGLSGISGSFALGPAEAPEISARRIELHFDPLSWLPRVVEVRLVDPVIRAHVDANGRVTLPALQAWLDSLSQTQGKSRWVSDDLAVALTGLRADLATPAGAISVAGDLKLVKNLPVVAHLTAAPARFAWQGATVTLQKAVLDFVNGGRLRLALAGDIAHPAFAAQRFQADAAAEGLRWFSDDKALTVMLARLHVTANAGAVSLAAGGHADAPKLDVIATNARAVLRGHAISGKADLDGTAQAGFDPALADMLRAHDPTLARSIARNLTRLTLDFAAHVERQGGGNAVTLTRPLLVTGAAGGKLSVASASTKDWHLTLAGPGLPAVTLDLRNLDLSRGVVADAVLSARFDYAMLRGVALAGGGPVAWRDNALVFAPTRCLHVAAAQFTALARSASADLCSEAGKPLLTAGAQGWAFHAAARNASAFLPLPNAELRQGAGVLDFALDSAPIHGAIALSHAVLTDRAPSARFQPLSGGGAIALTGDMWRGSIRARTAKNDALGDVTFTHDMAAGQGGAHIAAKLAFAPDKLQPADISVLMTALKRAEGAARFTGEIGWGKAGVTSGGELAIDALDFITPLGKAHAVKTDIHFTSLLPPVTAPGQAIAIDHIDWTIPVAHVAVTFGVGNNALTVDSFDTDFAQGHAALQGGFTFKLDDPQHLSGTVLFANVALQSLLAASNLGDKVKTVGTISGAIPFTISPEGFRIANGHVAADGPGRLSLSRSLWAQGDAALSSNAVQDFAYQALENLAFTKMTADLKSVPGGRLQIVFHLVGQSDPPTRQEARVAITDILNGTAMYKQIPLPSGTPIDLTLDSSLNFDELLKSYAEAWSKSLSPGGGDGAGAKP